MNNLERMTKYSIGEYAEFKKECERLGYTDKDIDRILEFAKCDLLNDILDVLSSIESMTQSVNY